MGFYVFKISSAVADNYSITLINELTYTNLHLTDTITYLEDCVDIT